MKKKKQVVTEWLYFSQRKRLPFLKDHRVDSTTAPHERRKIRRELKEEIFKRDGIDIMVVATDVFGKSITLCINGLVDTGLSVFQDSNGFLTVDASLKAEQIQRKGRAG